MPGTRTCRPLFLTRNYTDLLTADGKTLFVIFFELFLEISI